MSLHPCQVHCAAGTEPEGEEKHLMRAFIFTGNGYPCSFIHSAFCSQASGEARQGKGGGEATHCPPPLHIANISEWIRRVCKEYCSLDPPSVPSSLRSRTPSLLRGKQTLSTKCHGPAEKMYIGESTHQLGTCLKEHQDACFKGFMDEPNK